VTKEFGIDKSKLLVTVYHTDDEAFDLWKKIAGLPDEKIIRIRPRQFLGDGPTGPCGPCSEIFYDHGDHIWGGPPGSRTRTATGSSRSGTSSSCSSSSSTTDERVDLPRPVDRHRHGAGADRRAAAGQARQLRHRPDARLIEASATPPRRRSGRAEERAATG
jgi:alanyl-tRNA synthetase